MKKRMQGRKLKKSRNSKRLANVLATTIIVGGNVIPITITLAETIDEQNTIKIGEVFDINTDAEIEEVADVVTEEVPAVKEEVVTEEVVATEVESEIKTEEMVTVGEVHEGFEEEKKVETEPEPVVAEVMDEEAVIDNNKERQTEELSKLENIDELTVDKLVEQLNILRKQLGVYAGKYEEYNYRFVEEVHTLILNIDDFLTYYLEYPEYWVIDELQSLIDRAKFRLETVDLHAMKDEEKVRKLYFSTITKAEEYLDNREKYHQLFFIELEDVFADINSGYDYEVYVEDMLYIIEQFNVAMSTLDENTRKIDEPEIGREIAVIYLGFEKIAEGGGGEVLRKIETHHGKVGETLTVDIPETIVDEKGTTWKIGEIVRSLTGVKEDDFVQRSYGVSKEVALDFRNDLREDTLFVRYEAVEASTKPETSTPTPAKPDSGNSENNTDNSSEKTGKEVEKESENKESQNETKKDSKDSEEKAGVKATVSKSNEKSLPQTGSVTGQAASIIGLIMIAIVGFFKLFNRKRS